MKKSLGLGLALGLGLSLIPAAAHTKPYSKEKGGLIKHWVL